MTAESLFSHADQATGGAASRETLTRQQLLERERSRRMALIAERTRGGAAANESPASADEGGTTPPKSALPAGFETEERWQDALGVAADIAGAVRQAGHPSDVLERGRDELEADDLARAVVEAVRFLPPFEGVRLLTAAHQAQMPVLRDEQARHAQLLIEGLPNKESGGQRPPEGREPDSVVEHAWRLYADSERLRYSTVGTDEQRELLEYLPLPVIDDLIDAGRLTARAVPDDGARRLYLQARLTPSDVDREGLEELGWHDELARREFHTRLADGDISVLEQETGCTRSQRELISALKEVSRTGRVTPHLADKRWLWRALERLAPQTPINLRRDKAFAPWLLVRRIQRALRLAHQAHIRGEDQKYETMLRTAWNDAKALQGSWTLAGWEAKNVIAYLLALHGDTGPRYEDALDALSPEPGSGLREDRLSGQARHHLEANRDVLRKLMRQRDRSHVLNPYLVLGVTDGTEDWKGRWRELRRTLDMDGESLVNEAKDAIEALERGHASVPSYTVLLMPEKWANPRAEAPELSRGALPLPRQTASATEDERQFARQQAAAAIVGAACDNVGLPPVGETTTEYPFQESSSE
ncbi:hypothetical protein OG258_43105 [Streptomyces mirabilis]|uniref:hypothetical protein n=1 Tax=Streptomyces mirabilis TaxID=68239 RepID=UPI002E2D3BAF|nr:hypothetical protein [Streptomyces mirabilis]